MRKGSMAGAVAALALVAGSAGPAAGQGGWSTVEDGRCQESWGRGDRDRHCEVREATFAPSARLDVDGGRNGGVRVEGWDRDEVSVRARVWANSRDGEARARDLAGSVEIVYRDGRLWAEGPGRLHDEGWGVSFEVLVPRRTDLRLETHNGGISVTDVRGEIDFRALNGGVRLIAVAGDVRGRTTNGGLHVELAGDRWVGSGLDVETTNGGVEILVPEGYSAQLETGTVNGGIDLDFPIMVQGRIGRRLATTLGEGGARIRATTTNGGVELRRTGGMPRR